jgi:hypothetical protein
LHTAIYQDAEMAAIKALEQVPQSAPGSAVRGRNGYENYGAIRTKPGRADSPPTISFSCSDKIATWAVLGLQGAMLESLFDPVYLTGVVIGGVTESDPQGEDLRHKVRPEIARAIWGRLDNLEGVSYPFTRSLLMPTDTYPRAIAQTVPPFSTRSHLYLSCIQLLETRYFPSCRYRSLYFYSLHFARSALLPLA